MVLSLDPYPRSDFTGMDRFIKSINMKTNKSIVEYFGIALQVVLSIIVIVIMVLFSKDDPWLPIMGLLIIYLIWEKKLIDSKSKKENEKDR